MFVDQSYYCTSLINCAYIYVARGRGGGARAVFRSVPRPNTVRGHHYPLYFTRDCRNVKIRGFFNTLLAFFHCGYYSTQESERECDRD